MLQGVQCPYAHGVYERNLHPSKYRTQLCTEGNHCSRHVCFFAHSPFQLRAPTLLWSVEEAVSPSDSYQGCYRLHHQLVMIKLNIRHNVV